MIVLTLVSMVLNASYHYGWAKMMLILLNTLSITITYHVFNVDYAVMSSYFPLIFCFAYFFDLSSEQKPFGVGLVFVLLCIASNFLLPRQYFYAVNLAPELAASSNLFHILISFGITGLLVWVILKNQISTKKKLIEAKNEAEQYNKLQSDFLANISHEIRTPLNGIIGMSELLKSTKEKEEFDEYLRTIRASGHLLNAIVSDVLDISKLEAGELELNKSSFRLRSSVKNSYNMVSASIKKKPLKIVSHVEEAIPEFLKGDRNRLEQIMSNLLNNAVKFTDDGEITLEVRKVAESDAAVELQFLIKDTGIGIPRAKQEMLFNRFYQVGHAQDHKYPGTGLGLSICKSLVELMEGNIWVESELGRGSCFYFVARFEKAFDQTQSKLKSEKLLDLSRYTILVVEDNPVNQMVIMKMLERMNAVVTLAEDGIEAEELLDQRSFDLVFMDLQMPRQDGLDTTRHVRAKPLVKQPYIVALTANAFQESMDQCAEAGMNDYLSKPVIMSDLQKICEMFLKSNEALVPSRD